jgi:ankyrin repeat protein
MKEGWGSDDSPDVAVGFIDGSLLHAALSTPDGDTTDPPPHLADLRLENAIEGSRIESAKEAGTGLNACATGDVAHLRALLAAGWDAAAVIDRQRSNGLHWAAGGGHTEVCR